MCGGQRPLYRLRWCVDSAGQLVGSLSRNLFHLLGVAVLSFMKRKTESAKMRRDEERVAEFCTNEYSLHSPRPLVFVERRVGGTRTAAAQLAARSCGLGPAAID